MGRVLRRQFVLVVLALAVARAAAAQTGSISGTVTGPPSTTVNVYTATAQLADATFVATTDVDFSTHRYTLSGLAPGTYFVRTAAPTINSPFVDQWYPAIPVASSGARPQGVEVTAGATTSGIDFALTQVSGTINGTLTLATLPFRGSVNVPRVQVYNDANLVVGAASLLATPGASEGGPLDTDPHAGGTWTWTVAGLPSGRYYVKTSNAAASAGNNGHLGGSSSGWWVDKVYDNVTCVTADCTPSRGTPISVSAGVNGSGGSSPPSVNFSLEYGAQISGAVPTPTFLGTTRVEIYDSRGVLLPDRSRGSAVSLDRGYFANGLPAGTYYLKLRRDPQGNFPEELYQDQPCSGCAVTSGTPVTVALGEARTGIDFSALPSQAIRGRVRTGGASASGAMVEIYTASDEKLGSTTTAADGTYWFVGLNPGAFYLRTVNTAGFVDAVYQNQPCPNCDALQGTAITVTAGADTTGVDFDLGPGSTVAGLVQGDPGTAPGFSAAPVSGVGVIVYTSQGARAGTAVSDRTGHFTLTLPTGTFVATTNAEAGFRRKLYSDKDCPAGRCDLSSGTPIPVVGLPVTGINFTLPQCAAPSVSPVTLANAAVGASYRQTLAYTAGPPSGGFTIKSGILPPGLALDRPSGVIAGTPTAPGRFTFTIAAETTDCAGVRTYTLDVPACVFNAPPVLTVPAAGTASLLGQSCTGAWMVTSDQSWIHTSRTETTHPGPGGTEALEQASIGVDANSSSISRSGHITLGSRNITVFQSGTAMSPPFGVIDTPANGAVVSGSIAVSGWALDDLGVSSVSIYRDPVGGEGGQVFIGQATFVTGARPDVEAAYPSIASNTRAGWGYLLLTNMLPGQGNGTFNLYAYAADADGNRVLLGARTISAANSSALTPFGAIDTPDQGASIAGSGYVNFGWALTPQPKMIPLDGSTITVVLDGVSVGPLTSYNLYRSDVSGLFPGLKNSGGPVGYRVIDTTALSEGVHAIAWVAIDDAGKATGIGSRYFTVQNSAWQSLRAAAAFAAPPAFSRAEIAVADRTTAVPARIDGADLGRHPESLTVLPAVRAAARTIDLHQLQRLELALATQTQTGDEVCAPTYEGYLSANGELRSLPTGSSLDRAGTFFWQPGPGFLGVYQLVFVRTACDGTRERVPVTVRIR